jgi:hypothetical protein
MKATKGGQLLGDFIVLCTEEFPDRKWLDEFESGTRPASGG